MDANTEEYTAKLNRRNKAALFATIVSVGLIVLLGGWDRTAAGIAILGVAFSWAFGSNSRLLHRAFVACGLLLLAPPLLDGLYWPSTKLALIDTEKNLVESQREMVKTDISLDPRVRPEKQLASDYADLAKYETELAQLQNQQALSHVLQIDWGLIIGGLLLLSSGVGLLLG